MSRSLPVITRSSFAWVTGLRPSLRRESAKSDTSRRSMPASVIAAMRLGAASVTLGLCLSLTTSLAFAATPFRLIALGDSLTQGYGLPDGQGFVPQLEAWLKEKGKDVKVVNAGVSGDTTQGGLSRLEWTLAEGGDGMMVTLGGNDLLRGLDPALSRRNLDAILEGAKAKGVKVLLVAMESPGNYGPEYREAFDRIYPELAEKHGVMLAEPFLKPLVRGEDNASVMREFMQSDGIHPNREGVAKIVEGLGPKVLEFIESTDLK